MAASPGTSEPPPRSRHAPTSLARECQPQRGEASGPTPRPVPGRRRVPVHHPALAAAWHARAMTVLLNPYLTFRDNAREAMEFYQSVFGGELDVMPFSTVGAGEPDEADRVMHSSLRTSSGLVLMGADTPSDMEYAPAAGITVSLSGDVDDDDELRGYWKALSESGSVTVPLETAPWGDSFGMCVDRFGTPWMVNIAGQRS